MEAIRKIDHSDDKNQFHDLFCFKARCQFVNIRLLERPGPSREFLGKPNGAALFFAKHLWLRTTAFLKRFDLFVRGSLT